HPLWRRHLRSPKATGTLRRNFAQECLRQGERTTHKNPKYRWEQTYGVEMFILLRELGQLSQLEEKLQLFTAEYPPFPRGSRVWRSFWLRTAAQRSPSAD